MPENELREGLKADRDDEAKAVRDYGTRQKQARSVGRHGLAKRLGRIRRDERGHHKTVSRALR